MKFSQIEPLEARIAPATISIANAPAVTEGNSGTVTATFTVSLSVPATAETTVNYATADGTAISTGSFADYVAKNGTLTFAVGEQSKTIGVEVNGDVFAEGTQTFSLNLSSPSTGNTLGTATGTGTITDDDAAAVVSIAPATDVTEGAAASSNFTVTLSHAVESPVTVNFETGVAADTARPGPGAFTDYVAKKGTLTFAPGGALTQQISVALTDDTFKEDTEQFTVTLSGASGGALGTASAVGKILNDTDTTVGVKLQDARIVEGATGATATVTAELSAKIGTAVTFAVTTQNGTAVAGSDFTEISQSITIPANQLTKAITVPIVNSPEFETAENFYVNATGVNGAVTPVNDHPVNPTAQMSSRVTILDDDLGAVTSKELRWTDIDGDIVTLKVSKGALLTAFGTLNTDAVNLVQKGTMGGYELLLLNLNSSAFAGANVSITAAKQLGLPDATDGRVDVGFIQAANFYPSELQVIGQDLGVVTIDGDLAKISAGDSFSTPAIRKLDVYSLGVNTSTIAGLNADFKNVQSDVLGPISTLSVKTDVSGFLHVVGAEFGVIGTLNIGGALKGLSTEKFGGTLGDLSTENTGRITVSGKIAKATVGSIVGGASANTGLLGGSDFNNGKGGSAQTGVVGTVVVKGDVTGGSGTNSGAIFSRVNIAGITINGDLVGGAGSGSGGIVAGGKIGKLQIDGDLRGGNSTAAAFVNETGFISAATLSSVKIGGDIVSGTDGGKGIASSGSIRADVITSLEVGGAVRGNRGTNDAGVLVPVIISASGLNNLLAIKNLKIAGDVQFAEILAGYRSNSDSAAQTQYAAGKLGRGAAINGDASIGAIEIGGNVRELNIAAGVAAGANDRFGAVGTNAATQIAAVSGTSINSPIILSKIASVVIKGTITTNPASYGIVAQAIGSIVFGTPATSVPLNAGPSNDTTGTAIDLASKNFTAIELPIA